MRIASETAAKHEGKEITYPMVTGDNLAKLVRIRTALGVANQEALGRVLDEFLENHSEIGAQRQGRVRVQIPRRRTEVSSEPILLRDGYVYVDGTVKRFNSTVKRDGTANIESDHLISLMRVASF